MPTEERVTVAGVDAYETDGDRVEFTCETVSPETATPRTVPVTLEFYDPRTFRFELRANPEVAPDREYPELSPSALDAEVEPTATERDGRLELDTGALTVVVGLDEWAFRVEDDGEVLFEEQRADLDVFARSRVEPLGFTQEEINHNPRRVSRTGTAFSLAPDEHLFGVGEQFVELSRRGREFDLWHEEPLGTETTRAYKNIPFHLSTKGYGLLVDTTARVRYDFGASSTASGRVSVDDDAFAFVFFYGPSFRDVLTQYTAVTGRADRPPKWSFGTWMSRLGYESREELESVADRLREESIPSDVVHLDPFWMRDRSSCDLEWDTEQFPDPEGMIAGLREDDFHLSLWEHPHVPVGTEAFAEGAGEGYFVTDGTGKPYVMDHTCQGDYRGALVDFTDPDAVDWWKGKHRRLLEMGVDVFKTDYGEYVPADAVFANGKSGEAMHNLYPYLYNEAVYETVAAVNGADEAIVWGRSAWTGSQRFPMHWGGDPQTTWNGMAAALRGGLSASLSGIAYWSHDIGGFRGTPSTELYVRWAQFGLLSSNARCHGTTPREPWAFGEEALEIFRRYARLRYSLLPYLYTYAEVAARTGIPVVRPLLLEHQDDPTTYTVDSEYLLGPDLLVAPVFGPKRERSVYLPEGEWVDFWTGDRHEGGRRVTVDAPLDTMPVFRRAGGVLTRREPTESVQSGTPTEIRFEAVLPERSAAEEDSSSTQEATGTYFDEDADALVDVRAALTAGTLTVEHGDLSAEEIRFEIDCPAPDRVVVNGEEVECASGDPADERSVVDGSGSSGWVVDDGTVVIEP